MANKVVVPEVRLGMGDRTLPVIGMGTASDPPADPETAKTAIVEAIRAGYRHFDTAFGYGSEQPLGEAITEALDLGLIKARAELFITTKLWASFAQRDLVVPALNMSLRNLQLEYVDLYLIHWPLKLSQQVTKFPVENEEHISPLDVKSVWKGMEECQQLGLTKAIGVSNFSCNKLRDLLSVAKIPPALNQVEMNPFWHQKTLREFCKEKGIHITAYTPLGASGTRWGSDKVIASNVLGEIGKTRGKSIAQIALRWVYEQGVSVVPKSFDKKRMRQNLDIFDFSLTEEESNRISLLPQSKTVTFAASLGTHDLVLEVDSEI